MYEAGSAWYTLGARVLRDGFDHYGRLVSAAKQEREHSVALGARTSPEGFTKYNELLSRTKQNLTEFSVRAKAAWDQVSASTTRMVASSDRELGSLRRALGTTADAYGRVRGAVRETSRVAVDDQARMARAAAESATRQKAAADEVIRSNERVAASAAGAAGGGGGRNLRSPVAAGGLGPGDQSAAQAHKATAAWKEGFNSLATFGKWATLGILGLGGISVKVASDFQKQMEMVHTQAGASQREVDTLTKRVLALAPAVGIGPEKLAEGLFHVESHGVRGAAAMKDLTIAAEGARVGNANLEQVTTALVGVLASAPKDIHGAAEAMGVLNDIVGQGNLRMQDLVAALGSGIVPAGKAVGLGLRDVGAALDVMTSRAIPAQEGATRLRTVLGLIANPTNKAQKALDELGFSHDRLAQDFRKKGLVGALQDLQKAMGNVFGRRLTHDEEQKALTEYAARLKDAGVSAHAAEKSLRLFKEQLDKNGEGAIHSSQLIAEAFGGARMGTTMQILMQNVDDVKKHFDNLNRAGAAQRFQRDWQATQKTFAQRAAELGASVQVLAVRLGNFLIPKVEALVKSLIEAGKWLAHHKALAEALAYAFGTLLVAAITAFFARFIGRTAEGIASIGKFAAAIGRLPSKIEQAAASYVAAKQEEIAADEEQLALMKEVELQAGKTGAALTAEAGAGVGGGAGGVGGALGPIEGLITGIRGTLAPGSTENPLAVFVVDPGGMGGIPHGGTPLSKAEGAALAAEQGTIRSGPVQRGLVVGGSESLAASGTAAVGAIGRGAGALLRGAGIAGIGVLGAQTAGSIVGGRAGQAVSTIGTAGAIGAGVGSIVPGIGTALGAGLGAAAGVALQIFGHHGDYGKQIADTMTKGFGGAAEANLKRDVGGHLNAAQKALTGTVKENNKITLTELAKGASNIRIQGPSAAAQAKAHAEYKAAGLEVAKQLEKGWNQYKFQDEPTMFKQLRAETRKMPPEARAHAVESAIAFASGLESKGRLTKGSADRMLAQAQVAFPGFEKYLHLQGVKSANTFAAAFNLGRAEVNIRKQLNRIANDFPTVEEALAKAHGDTQVAANGMARALMDVIKHGTGPMKKQAEKDLQELRDQEKVYFKSMASEAQLRAGELKDSISKGSASAAQAAGQNFQAFVTAVKAAMKSGALTTKQGMAIINRETIKELEQLGVTAKDAQKLSASGYSVGDITKAISSAGSVGIGTAKTSTGQTITIAAGGGMLPGGEFGYQDNMTLVDPLGRPRARMAGDEAIYNRHQQPFVELGLRAIGFNGSQDLWNKVNLPHAYSSGGLLPTFAGGGKWVRTGATIDPTQGQAPTYSAHGGFSFAELLEAGPNAGMRPDLTQLLGLPRSSFGMPMETPIDTRMPGSKKSFQIWKNDVGSGQPGNAHFTVDLHQAIATAMGWHPNQDIEVAVAGTDPNAQVVGGGGVGSGAATWTDIKAPKVKAAGVIPGIVDRVLKKVTDAANAYGRAHVPAASSTPGGLPTGRITGGGKGAYSAVLPVSRTDQGLDFAGAGPIGAVLDGVVTHVGLWPGWPGTGGIVYKTSIGNVYDMEHVTPDPSLHVGSQVKAGQRVGWVLPGSPWLETGLANASSTGPLTPYNGAADGTPMPGGLAFRHWLGFARGGKLPGFAGGGALVRGQLAAPVASLLGPPRHRPGEDQMARDPRNIPEHRFGGILPGFQHGGSHRKPRTTTIRLPGGRAPIHVSGGRIVTPKAPKQTKRKKTPISQTTAQVLARLGLSEFTTDQNMLGQLDNRYTMQENLFTTFDQGQAGLPIGDLDALMSIREEQWDILFKEWHDLPGAIARLQKDLTKRIGVPSRTTTNVKTTIGPQAGIGEFGSGVETVVHHHPATGETATQNQITSVEKEITRLQADIKKDTRRLATEHHKITGEAMTLSDNYAHQTATALDGMAAITDARHALARQVTALRTQLHHLPPSSTTGRKSGGTSSTDWNPSQLASLIMSGGTLSKARSGTGSHTRAHESPARRHIQSQLDNIAAHAGKLTGSADQVHKLLRSLNDARKKAASRLKHQGWDEAWAIQQHKWRLQDRIDKLKTKLAALKATLAKEQAVINPEQAALTQVNSWLTGGLQGDQSIQQSLGDTGMNMLTLYQQGADLPTPGRKGPTLSTITKLLSDPPPKGFGLTLPAGLGGPQPGGVAGAVQEFLNFQTARADLFSQFGSNFVPAGTNPFAGTAGLAAGVQFYGAAAGARSGTGLNRGGLAWPVVMSTAPSPGRTTHINIEQHFSSGPADPHHYAAGLMHEFSAMG